MILVDTSVWVETFKKNDPLDLESIIPFEDIVTCLPVIQEILQGFAQESSYRIAREAMLNLPIVENPISLSLIEEAAGLYRPARRQGFTIRSSADCLIAACALRHDLEIYHRDRDFSSLARVSALRQRSLSGPLGR